MTTIGSLAYTPPADNRTVIKIQDSVTNFSDQIVHETEEKMATDSGSLPKLLDDLNDLKNKRLTLSIKDYLTSYFTLKEKISEEKINMGEHLDTIGINFKGRVYNIAGKIYSPGSWNIPIISDGEKHTIALPEDRPGSVLQGNTRADIKI